MRRLVKFFRYFLLILITPILLYFIMVVIGMVIPVNTEMEIPDKDVEIFLVSNGLHIDIAVPLKTEYFDWTSLVKTSHTPSGWPYAKYVSFGWGDLEFYKTTPQWDDLTLGTAFKSLFTKTPAAIHTTFYEDLSQREDIKRVVIDSARYRKLTRYIASSFEYDGAGNLMPVEGLHYSNDDVFYKAKGSLTLFKTCNTWVNSGLKKSDLKACLWTPFVEGVFMRYP